MVNLENLLMAVETLKRRVSFLERNASTQPSLFTRGAGAARVRWWEATNRAALNALSGTQNKDFGYTTEELGPGQHIYYIKINGTFQRWSHFNAEEEE